MILPHAGQVPEDNQLEECAQLGSDRIVVLTFGSGEWENSLVLELYDKGNVLLTDPSQTILTLLRNSKFDTDSRLTVGDAWPLGRDEAALVLQEQLRERFSKQDRLLHAAPRGELLEPVQLFAAVVAGLEHHTLFAGQAKPISAQILGPPEGPLRPPEQLGRGPPVHASERQ